MTRTDDADTTIRALKRHDLRAVGLEIADGQFGLGAEDYAFAIEESSRKSHLLHLGTDPRISPYIAPLAGIHGP